MDSKTIRKLHELKAKLEISAFITRSHADRAEATVHEMESQYFKGYYQAEAATYRLTARRFEGLHKNLIEILKEVPNG